jgi:putative phosphoesterase
MKLGILSDTHGRADAARRAVALLEAGGAEHLVHCGDVGAEAVLDCLLGLPALFVFGNCDYDREALERHARIIGVRCGGRLATLEMAGRRIAITHGDDTGTVLQLLESQQYDYVLVGHTHRPLDRPAGRTRLINPGALHRAHPRTVALLNLDDGMLDVIEVEGI